MYFLCKLQNKKFQIQINHFKKNYAPTEVCLMVASVFFFFIIICFSFPKYLPKGPNEKCSKFEKWLLNKTNNLDYTEKIFDI